MSNEKPVELTEAELDALTEAGEVALPNRALVAAIVDDLVPAIIRIVTAREAAARREALLPFAQLADNLDKAAEWNELSVRERKERWPEDLAHGVSRPSASLRARTLLRAALAEPERGGEDGR